MDGGDLYDKICLQGYKNAQKYSHKRASAELVHNLPLAMGRPATITQEKPEQKPTAWGCGHSGGGVATAEGVWSGPSGHLLICRSP